MTKKFEISKEELKRLISSQLSSRNRNINLIAKNLTILSCEEQVKLLKPMWQDNAGLTPKLEKNVMITFLKGLVEEGKILDRSLWSVIVTLDIETQKRIFQPLIDNDFLLLKQ